MYLMRQGEVFSPVKFAKKHNRYIIHLSRPFTEHNNILLIHHVRSCAPRPNWKTAVNTLTLIEQVGGHAIVETTILTERGHSDKTIDFFDNFYEYSSLYKGVTLQPGDTGRYRYKNIKKAPQTQMPEVPFPPSNLTPVTAYAISYKSRPH